LDADARASGLVSILTFSPCAFDVQVTKSIEGEDRWKQHALSKNYQRFLPKAAFDRSSVFSNPLRFGTL
jgi:hypothetical protein